MKPEISSNPPVEETVSQFGTDDPTTTTVNSVPGLTSAVPDETASSQSPGDGEQVAVPTVSTKPSEILIEAPTPHVALPAHAKRDNKLLIAIVGGVVLFVMVAAASYFIYASLHTTVKESATKTTTSTQTKTAKTSTPASTLTPDAAVDDLTNGITTESTITNSDDSSAATDAGAAASSAGSAINENDF